MLVWCGKKEAPAVTQLPTQVIKQNVEPTQDTQWDDSWSVPEEDNQQADASGSKEEVFDPKVYEAENDEIEQLVNILEELIEEQESE